MVYLYNILVKHRGFESEQLPWGLPFLTSQTSPIVHLLNLEVQSFKFVGKNKKKSRATLRLVLLAEGLKKVSSTGETLTLMTGLTEIHTNVLKPKCEAISECWEISKNQKPEFRAEQSRGWALVKCFFSVSLWVSWKDLNWVLTVIRLIHQLFVWA